MTAINSVMTASLSRERHRLTPDVGLIKQELDLENETDCEISREVVKTERLIVKENACDCSLVARELEEGEVSG